MLGSGNRVQLQFNEGMKVRGAVKGSGGMGIFPGAMVGVTGRNGGGRIFGVDEIIMVSVLSTSQASSSFYKESDELRFYFSRCLPS